MLTKTTFAVLGAALIASGSVYAQYSKGTYEARFEKADKNKDGQLSRSEFDAMVKGDSSASAGGSSTSGAAGSQPSSSAGASKAPSTGAAPAASTPKAPSSDTKSSK